MDMSFAGQKLTAESHEALLRTWKRRIIFHKRGVTEDTVRRTVAFYEKLDSKTLHNRFNGGVSPEAAGKAFEDVISISPPGSKSIFFTFEPDGLEGEIQGDCIACQCGSVLEIGMTVAGEYQNHHIGREMLKKCIRVAKVLQVSGLILITASYNDAMIKLGRSFGFGYDLELTQEYGTYSMARVLA